MWLRYACDRLILPEAVFTNRFFAPLRVLIFGMGVFLLLDFCRFRFDFSLPVGRENHDHALPFHMWWLVDL